MHSRYGLRFPSPLTRLVKGRDALRRRFRQLGTGVAFLTPVILMTHSAIIFRFQLTGIIYYTVLVQPVGSVEFRSQIILVQVAPSAVGRGDLIVMAIEAGGHWGHISFGDSVVFVVEV